MKNYLLLIVLFINLSSCKTARQVTRTESTENHTTEHKTYELDSVYIYKTDSVFITRVADTMFIDRTRTLYKDVVRLRTDTLCKTDSVYLYKSVQAKPSAMSLFWQKLGKISSLVFVIIVLFLILRWKWK